MSLDLLDQFRKPQFSTIDVAIKAPISKGYGFMFEKHPLKPGHWLYGHPGVLYVKALISQFKAMAVAQ